MLRIYAPFTALLALVLITPPGWAQDININDVTVTEGNSGQVDAVFQVTLTAASPSEVKIKYTTEAGTATSGAACGAADFLAKTGGLTIPAGSVSQPLTVKVCGDTSDEPDETFRVRLTQAQGGTIQDNQGDGTITDDDQPSTPPPGGGTDVRRADPTAPAIVPTSTDLTLTVGQQNVGYFNWVTELTLGTPGDIAPNGLRFNWSRPAAGIRIGRSDPTDAIRGALTQKAQWQMVFSATPTETVMFLPSSGTGPSGLPLFALYSYGNVTVAGYGSSAEFAIPRAEFPANPPGGVISVRVVLSTNDGLHASPWVKISMLGPGPQDRVAITDETYAGTPLWFTLTQIESVVETLDGDVGSNDDEIYVAVGTVDLTAPAGSPRRASVFISPVYEDVDAGERRDVNAILWGTDHEPRPISQPSNAVIMVLLIEHDDSEAGGASELEAILESTVDELRGASRSVLVDKLENAFWDFINQRYTGGILAGDDYFATPAVPAILTFTDTDLDAARTGQTVRKVITTGHSCCGVQIAGSHSADNAQYRIHFHLKKGTTSPY